VSREKGHATVLFSREELLLLEFCVLLTVEQGNLDADTRKDAADLLRELRVYLGNDPQAIGERILEKLKGNLDA
jgi:hypothetical protein